MARTRSLALLCVSLGSVLLTAACGSSGGGAGGTHANGLPVGGSGSAPAAQGKVGVVAGENFWGNITQQLGGDQVSVTSIISDPNADPHEYESSVANAAAIAHANIVIENGAGYDDFMSKLLSAGGGHDRVTLDIAKIVGVSGKNPNPHLWYDPTYVDRAAQAITDQLAKARPAQAATFRANLATFRAGEQQVVGVIDQIKAKYDGAPIAYTERVPGYLIQAAGLRLGTPAAFSQAIEDDTDPSPLDNATFENDIKDHKVKVLLYNAQVTDPETDHLKSLATSNHVPVVGVTETLPPKYQTFQAWQLAQAKALLAALGG